MDKNMINIDDLFKQRLSGGEKDERPGAWLQMREMLDQQMPVTPTPAGSTFNWRRMLGVLAGVATLSVVSVGGYELVTSFRQGGNANGNGPVVASTTNTGAAHTARRAANSHQQFSNDDANTVSGNAGSSAGATSTNTGNDNTAKKNTTVADNDNSTNGINGSSTNTVRTAGITANTGKTIAANNTGASTSNASVNTAGNIKSAINTGAGTASGTGGSQTDENGDRLAGRNNNTPAVVAKGDNSSNADLSVASSGDDNSIVNNQNEQSLNTSANNNNVNNSFGAIASNNSSAPANRDEATVATTQNYNAGTTRDRGTLERKNTTQKKNVFSSAASAKIANKALPVATGDGAANGKRSGASGNGLANNSNTGKSKTNAAANTTANSTTKSNTATGNARNNSLKPAVDQQVANNTTGTAATYTLIKEPIRKIEILERYSKGGQLKVDTIFNGTVEMDKYVFAAASKPSGDEQALQASSADATVTAGKTDVKEELVPLQKYRTSHNKQPLWEPRRFEEMVQNAKLNMSSVRFYPGLIVGANTLLSGKNSMTGFQLGLSGTLSLNERWALFTELKYVHRFHNGTLDSKSDKVTSSIQNGTTTYTVTPKTSQFSFPSLSSMELPIAVRYTLNRINVFMGVNYAYYFATNPSLIEINEAPVTTTTEPTADPNAVNLATTDFSSRYGVGYMLGMGYHFTPAVHVDLRLAHSVWDNANTNGTRYVSQNLFRVPTLQINFNYRFSSKNKMR